MTDTQITSGRASARATGSGSAPGRAARPGGGQGPGGPGAPRRIDPADRAQLERAPVPFARVARLFAPYRRQLVLVTLIIVAISIVSMASPFLVREAVDVAIPEQDVQLLLLVVAGMVGVAVITSLLGVVQTWMSAEVGQRVMHTLRTRLFGHLQGQSLGFFTRSRAGEVQSRLINDVGGMQAVVTTSATSVASNLTTAIATAVAMLALSWRLSLISLIVVPPAIWVTRRVALMRREITAAQQARLADLHVRIEEGLSVSGIRLAKTMGTTRRDAVRFDEVSHDLIDLEMRSQLAGRWRMATMQIVFAAIPAAIYLAAGLPATSGGMTIGTLIAFTTLQAGIFRPLMGLLNVGAQWVSSMALFSRVFEYLDLEPDLMPPSDPVDLDPARVRGEVTLDEVSYRYDGAERDALSEVSLAVPAGGSLALVGHTGSGKSTLAALVARLHDPTGGAVRIDGVDVRDLDPEVLAQIVGVVSQETYLVHASVRDNLLLAAPEADDARLWRALASAQVADLVAALPEGLDTLVGSRGYRFSGGEQQRIAIARTLLRDPKVLVLDEATSALDNETERALQLAIDTVAKGRTTITIAHRLSTVQQADQIVVLDDGRVVERGSHGDLIAADGAYAGLALAA